MVIILRIKGPLSALVFFISLGACGVRGRPQPPTEPAYIFNKQKLNNQDKHDKSSPSMPEQSP